jgi:hypothetical protein
MKRFIPSTPEHWEVVQCIAAMMAVLSVIFYFYSL